MQDYYALYGILNSTRIPFTGSELNPRQRDLVPLLPAAEVEALRKPYRKASAVAIPSPIGITTKWIKRNHMPARLKCRRNGRSNLRKRSGSTQTFVKQAFYLLIETDVFAPKNLI